MAAVTTKRTTRTTRWAVLLASAGLALAGCGGSDDAAKGGSAAGESRQVTESAADGSARDAGATTQAGSQASSRATDTSGSSMKTPTGTHVARTASLSLTVEDVARASASVRSAADRVGGYVSSEDSRTDDGHRGDWAEITVTVPVDQLDATLTRLADVGEVTHRSSEAEDLTAQYTDTDARVRTMTRSVERLQDLIDASEDLDQVVTLERELSRREADLESMTAQQKSLEKRTTTAPITVSLTSTDAPEPTEEPTGFVAGLAGGWDAFTEAVTGGLTVLGAVTPFAAVLVLVGAPLVWAARRRRRRVSAR